MWIFILFFISFLGACDVWPFLSSNVLFGFIEIEHLITIVLLVVLVFLYNFVVFFLALYVI